MGEKKPTKKYLHKLGENDEEIGYIKPQITTTELMTDEEIKKALEDYIKVEPSQLVKSDHVRYFSINEDNTTSFRLGGWIVKNGSPDYVVLTNGKSNWSAQCKSSIFYKKMTNTETVDEYKMFIAKKNDKIEELKENLVEMTTKMKELKEKNKILTQDNKEILKLLTQKNKQIKQLETALKKSQKKQ